MAKSKAKKAAAKTKEVTKLELARKIFEASEGVSRKDVIQAFVKEAGLTETGAGTYYQRFMSELSRTARKKHASAVRGRPADENSMAGQARKLFQKYGSKLSRKDMISKFEGVGLTPAGAATYYQTIQSQQAA